MQVNWQGVWPAVMTQFNDNETLDLDGTATLIERLIAAGVDGLIMLGTLGENTALEPAEKRHVVRTAIAVADGRVPVMAGVAENSTALASRFAGDMERLGADGLMVLPAMVYKSEGEETIRHFRDVAKASALPIMIYNNPVSYGVDVTPAMFAELAEEETIVAIKESSDDTRRLSDIANEVGERYVLFCGVDDLALEAFLLGARGWVAGLVNAFPAESVALYRLAEAGRWDEARALYRWFMPLLHLDTHVKLVQYIKLAQAMTGMGRENVRRPRLPLAGEERRRVEHVIRTAIAGRPALAA